MQAMQVSFLSKLITTRNMARLFLLCETARHHPLFVTFTAWHFHRPRYNGLDIITRSKTVTDNEIEQPKSINDLHPKMKVKGQITETRLYGALVDIGLEQTGLIHISQLSRDHTNKVTDVVNVGDQIEAWVNQVEPDKNRIALSLIEPADVEWHELKPNQTYKGTVTRIENYGAFVDIGAERPGLLHVREMSSGYIQHPTEVVNMGDEIEVTIQKVNRQKRQIDLTMADADIDLDEILDQEPTQTAMEIALQRAQENKEPAQKRKSKKKQPSPDLSDRSDILARTLKNHSA